MFYMKFKLQLLLAFLFAFSLGVQAQESVVSGKVVDETGSALPGVNILVKGRAEGTTTDASGSYSLKAAGGSTLVFSFIGYVSQEVAIGTQTVINITLVSDVTTLNELVVVGYGTQQKKDITGSVAIVGSEAMEDRPNTQFGNLIQGKTAGVQVLTPSGEPNAGFRIQIRGANTLTAGNSEPLYVVDGIPTSGDTRTLNPADIESLTVLKDASAAAIYGAQGANGVVIITTKKGKAGAPKLDFSSYVGYSTAWRKLDVLNSEQYRDLMTELGQNTDWSRYTANTDWQNEIFGNGTSQNYQISLSGRTDNTGYYVSAGWVQQKGAVRSAEMDRYNFRISLDQKVNNFLSVGTNLNYIRYRDVDVNDNQAINQGGVILGMLSTPPNIGIYNADGTFTSNPFQDWENPIASTDGSDREYRNQRVLANAYAELNIIEGLKFRSNVGVDYNSSIYDYFLDPFRTSYGRARQGIAENRTDFNNLVIFDNTLTYSKTIDKHSFTVMGGTVAQNATFENARIETNGFTGAGIPTTNAGSIIVGARNEKGEASNFSIMGRVTYSYADKYLFTSNLRRDGSSVFGPDVRFGLFPSFQAGWRVSEEAFMDGTRDFLDDLKIRFGYGQTGNDKITRYGWYGRVGVGSNYPIGGVIQPGSYPESIENRDLKWEVTTQTNLGIDVTALNGRVTLAADAYIKDTDDLLLNVPLPRSTGYDIGLKNIGSIQNRGLEFLVNSKNAVNDLKWETDFNITFNRTEVIDIQDQVLNDANIPGRGEVSRTMEGKPIGLFYGYVWGGVDPATGNAYYVDKNGESTFTPSTDDRRIIGNPNPDFFYGITNTFSYKNFQLSLFLQGVYGNDIFNATRVETEGMTDAKNQTADVARRWRQPGDVTDIPRAVFGNVGNSRISDRFVEDGSFMRIKALTLGYNVPTDILSKVKISNARLYVTGENLFTFTKYKGYDPEVNAFTNSTTVFGVDFGTYPQTRNIILGLNVSF